jgi:hypothetical protein
MVSAHELSADDFLEVERAPVSAPPRSGTMARVSEPPPLPQRRGRDSCTVKSIPRDLAKQIKRLEEPTAVLELRSEAEIGRLGPQAAFLVAIIDSRMSVVAIVRTSPMSRAVTLRALAELVESGVAVLT